MLAAETKFICRAGAETPTVPVVDGLVVVKELDVVMFEDRTVS